MAPDISTDGGAVPTPSPLHKFRLYKTRSNFYMIGRDKSRAFWRVLKIDRLDPEGLNIHEDPSKYSEKELAELQRRIDEGNRSTGGLKFVAICYGIVGFIKLLGPYYMLLITKRRKLGAIGCHTIYGIQSREMILIPDSSVQSSVVNSKEEKRYKRLLLMVDLTKNFFFSYSYNIMHSLQKNLCNKVAGESHYETMFVWNGFLTRGIRNSLKSTIWTVALVYGYFEQTKLSTFGGDFKFTLIARRSRHYAGTRYLRRGVNEKGIVANDVETEQIVSEDMPQGCRIRISSVVQNRGSIPLFWSQEMSRLNLKPDIILSRKDHNYSATRRHFENLEDRYGNPIIILDLIKTQEKKPRETILRREYVKAIRTINKDRSKGNILRSFHLDLDRIHSNKSVNALAVLVKLATLHLSYLNIFYCQLSPNLEPDELLDESTTKANNDESTTNCSDAQGSYHVKNPILQTGVLRTNCIDCLDRTNAAQYAFGLVALGRQLHTLGFIESPFINLDDTLAKSLMRIYERMGDTLAMQYGGSPAHNKIFSEIRGEWEAAIHSQEIIRSVQRFYSNAYLDVEKQNAINLFLGHFQPQQGKPALWELDSDQHHNIGARSVSFQRFHSNANLDGEIQDASNVLSGHFQAQQGLSQLLESESEQHYNVGSSSETFCPDTSRSFIKRSLSEGNILHENDSAVVAAVVENSQQLSEIGQGTINKGISESNPNILPFEADLASSGDLGRADPDHGYESESCHGTEHPNLHSHTTLGIDWLSSAGTSWNEETFDRFLNDGTLYNNGDVISNQSETGSSFQGEERNKEYTFSPDFARWVGSKLGVFQSEGWSLN